MAEFTLLDPSEFADFDLSTSGGANGSFVVIGAATAGIATGHANGFGEFEVIGEAISDNVVEGAGSFVVVGEAIGHLQSGHAYGWGDFTFITDSGANLITPQFAVVDGWTYVVGYSWASFHEPVTAGGSFKVLGYAANFNYVVAEGVFEIEGRARDIAANQFSAIVHGQLPYPSLFAIASTGTVGSASTSFVGEHGGEYLLTARTGAVAEAELPVGTLTASATAAVLVQIDALLPVGTLIASATTTTIASMEATHSGDWTVYAYTGANSSGVLPVGNLVANATPQVLARVDAQLPTGTLVAHAYRDNTASVIATLPALVVVSSGVMREAGPHPQFVGHAYIDYPFIYEGYSVTIREGRAGTETLTTAILNCPFEQIVRFGNHYLGAAADGLFEIGAEDAVDSVIRLAPDDFGTPTLKRPIALRISGRIETYLNVSLSVEEDDWLAPQQTTSRGGASNHRARLARGVSGRYFSYTLTNPGGGDFELDEVTPENHVLIRQLGGKNV